MTRQEEETERELMSVTKSTFVFVLFEQQEQQLLTSLFLHAGPRRANENSSVFYFLKYPS